jgi:hypothetical protein
MHPEIDRVTTSLTSTEGAAAVAIVSIVASVIIGRFGKGLFGAIALGFVSGAGGVIPSIRLSRLT